MNNIERTAKLAMKNAADSKAKKDGRPMSKAKQISIYVAALVGVVFSIILANNPKTVADGESFIFYIAAAVFVLLCVYILLDNKKKKNPEGKK